MTIQECYERLHGDYEQAQSRLMNDRLIERFILKFPADESMKLLVNSVEAKNYSEAFRGAHTLKGVAANLAFTQLQEVSSELAEELRNGNPLTNFDLYEKVKAAYALVIDTLAQYEAEK